MNIEILDSDFKSLYFLDTFDSFIWTERYSECGDFELYTLMKIELLNYIRLGNYISIDESDRLMIIENIEIETDFEDGDHLKVTGRSLESILDRRIIWPGITIDNSGMQDIIINLITNNAIIPNDATSLRKIPGLTTTTIQNSRLAAIQMSIQISGDNLYETIRKLCSLHEIGFKIVLENGQFVFSLYVGTNRKDQIVFSPDMENILNTDYIEATSTMKNAAYVYGEYDPGDDGTGNSDDNKIPVLKLLGLTSGLNRREIFVDANDIQSSVHDDNTDTDEYISDEEFEALLEQKGRETLYDHSTTHSFDGQIVNNKHYKLNTDYFLGDIVTLSNEYGLGENVRVTEIIRSVDENGYEIYPTFQAVSVE